MRSSTSFAIHAALATMLIALAATSAAAGGPSNIKLTEDPTAVTRGYLARNDGRVQQLEIQGWQWSGVSKVDSFTVKQGMKPFVTGENVQGSQDIVITGSRIPQPNLTSASPVKSAISPQTVSPRPLPADSALERGTLRVKVKMPWLACEEGRKYPALELSDGSQRVVLQDVVISSCGKVAVRGWDPKKKESVIGQAEPR